MLTRTTGAGAPPTADSWSGHIYPPLLKQTSWPDGDTVQQQQQQQQQLQFPPEAVSVHQEAVRISSAAAATGQPAGRSPGHAMTEQRGAFSERHQQVAVAAKPKAFAAAGESDKFRALERLNHLASRLRQQLPPSAGVELSGGKDHPAVQAPPRTHHHHQHRVQLKGPGSKSDSDSGFGGDAASTAGTADYKIKQVRGSVL